VDVAKQLDDRDAAHKVEVEQLKGRIAELLEEKEQREGQLKKAQELLVTSETDASNTHAELDVLKEQATKREVAIAQLNAELASKLQILFFLSARHNTIFSGITFTPTQTPAANILSIFQPCFMLPSKTLRRLCRRIG
jgi:chromosome segregation ATPase